MESFIITLWSSGYFWSWFWLLAYGLTVLFCVMIVIWADLTMRPLGRYIALSGAIHLAAIFIIVKVMRFI